MPTPAEETQGLARFEGARFYARTMGFCAVFAPGPVTLGDEWTPHPAYDDTFRADGAPELIVSRPDYRLVLGRCGRKLDMKRVRQLANSTFAGAAPAAVRVAPLAVALPLAGPLPFEPPPGGLHCHPIPIRDQKNAQYTGFSLQTHVTVGRRQRGRPLRTWLETSLITSPDRHLHYVGDLRRLVFIPQKRIPELVAAMLDELVEMEKVVVGLEVDAAARSQRRKLGVARVTRAGVIVDVRLPSPGRDLRFTVLSSAGLPEQS